MTDSLLTQLWAGVVRLLPPLIIAVVLIAALWFAMRYPAVPEGVEEIYWRKYTRRFWRRVREGKR